MTSCLTLFSGCKPTFPLHTLLCGNFGVQVILSSSCGRSSFPTLSDNLLATSCSFATINVDVDFCLQRRIDACILVVNSLVLCFYIMAFLCTSFTNKNYLTIEQSTERSKAHESAATTYFGLRLVCFCSLGVMRILNALLVAFLCSSVFSLFVVT